MNQSPLDHEENLKKAERAAYLIAGHLRGTLTPAEQDELDDWITDSDENLELFETLTDADNIEMAMQRYLEIERSKVVALAGIKERVGLLAKKRPVRKIGLYFMAAVFLFAVAGLYLLTRQNGIRPIEKPSARAVAAGDVPPGADKAVLMLSDGRTLILDSSSRGLLARQGDVRITSTAHGELVYDGTTTEMQYNRVSTPRGGQYDLVLGDGTHVWLNAESSLKFPAGFAATDREVELQGEGYFEVAKNPAKPFLVKIRDTNGEIGRVVVLGTHFNINSYGDDGLVKTTLVEGLVQAEKGSIIKQIRPGEQATFIGNSITVEKGDVEAATAWKKGTFLFRDATIRSIGEQIKRWYDLEVAYEGAVPQHFNTEVSRTMPLSVLLKGLEGTGQVHFELEGKKLIIRP